MSGLIRPLVELLYWDCDKIVVTSLLVKHMAASEEHIWATVPIYTLFCFCFFVCFFFLKLTTTFFLSHSASHFKGRLTVNRVGVRENTSTVHSWILKHIFLSVSGFHPYNVRTNLSLATTQLMDKAANVTLLSLYTAHSNGCRLRVSLPWRCNISEWFFKLII